MATSEEKTYDSASGGYKYNDLVEVKTTRIGNYIYFKAYKGIVYSVVN